jgi:bifunctional UDP-N-acetylglucosamine pyrophosphorylase/glucosamine-1-phosphate N-acetyltransferase
MSDKLAVVILAAGKGTRMVSDKPKVLHQLCGKPLLYHVLEAAKELKPSAVYAVVGYQAEDVEEAFKSEDINWINQGEQRGTGHALLATESFLSDWPGRLMVLCGDAPLITDRTLNKLMENHAKSDDTAMTVLTTRIDNPTGYGRIVRDSDNNITGIVEESEAAPEQKQIKEINSGAYVFDPAKVFRALKKIKAHHKSGEYHLPDVINILAERKETIESYLVSGEQAVECLGINSRTELLNASRIMQKRIMQEFIDKGISIIDPPNTYIEAGVDIGKDTVIYPFTVIRSGVTIGRHCEVGPFSHLRPGTVLDDHAEVGNFTETKKTHIGRHSKAKHLSYLGDADIGDEVNIGAGTITANYDGKSKHKTVIEDEAATGSGTILVAPVRMGKGAQTGAGAVVAKGKNVPDGVIVVGIPAQPIKKKAAEKHK